MAQLQPTTTTSFEIPNTAPAGTFPATCLNVRDRFNVERPSFDDPLKKELRDITRFLFGFRGPDGKLHLVETFEFRISGSPKANLVKFLTAWGSFEYGTDYCELVGQGALIQIEHKLSADGTRTFANIVGIAPVPSARAEEVLPLSTFTNATNAN